MAALSRVHLVGVDGTTLTKLLYTLALIAAVMVLRRVTRWAVRLLLRGRAHTSVRFWARQGINLAAAVVLVLGLISIWFDTGLHAAAAVGVLSAAAAFAMQRVIMSLAGYFLILRGDIFSVGDRIVMGGVRGDVIGLGFLRTTILEMGQPQGDQDDTLPTWVDARQYTGRIVTVTNGVVFDEPVYNYSREFGFLWEEIRVGVPYDADWRTAERLLREAATRHCVDVAEIGRGSIERMRRRYDVPTTELTPDVFVKLSESWIELAVRFVVPTHGIREIKSAITCDILTSFDEHGIAIAYPTYSVALAGGAGVSAYPEEPQETRPRRRPARRRS